MKQQNKPIVSRLNLLGEGCRPFRERLEEGGCRLIEMYYGHFEVMFPAGTRREMINTCVEYEQGSLFRVILPDGQVFIERVHPRGWYGWIYGIPFLFAEHDEEEDQVNESL